MTITETLYEKYDEIIKAMKQAYEDSLHQPWCIYCVDMNTGEVIYNKNVNTDFSI